MPDFRIVRNILGSVIRNVNSIIGSDLSIDLENGSDGIYFVEMNYGKMIITDKIIKANEN